MPTLRNTHCLRKSVVNHCRLLLPLFGPEPLSRRSDVKVSTISTFSASELWIYYTHKPRATPNNPTEGWKSCRPPPRVSGGGGTTRSDDSMTRGGSASTPAPRPDSLSEGNPTRGLGGWTLGVDLHDPRLGMSWRGAVGVLYGMECLKGVVTGRSGNISLLIGN
jgi:hypothetical protein